MKVPTAGVLMLGLLVMLAMARVEGKPKMRFKVINLTLYLYDKITSPNATGVRVAGPNGNTNTTQFGSLFVIDNQILDGPNYTTANEIGRSKGTFMIAAVNVDHAFLVFSAVLQTSKYNGTIAFQGTDKSVGIRQTKELAVVGGTGDFRLASGYANYTTTYLNIPDSVVLLQTVIVVPKF